MKGLSVIIPSYNTKDMTVRCIRSLEKALVKDGIPHEIIVVDNASADGSAETLKAMESPTVKTILNTENVGYGKANNQALKQAVYDYILYLNSDVLHDKVIDYKALLSYMDRHEDVGVLTVQVDLPDGTVDPASHRGFPTLWRSFTYFAGLERLFSRVPVLNRVFGGYHLCHLDRTTEHEIDSPTGAFYLTRRSLAARLNGFDEDFFMYGEDLDLSYRIRGQGMRVVYYPRYRVTHYKSHSGLKSRNGSTQRSKTRVHFYNAMAIFYRKHYACRYPAALNSLVYSLIRIKAKSV